MPLSNKRILITGAAGGIGSTALAAMSAAGAHVVGTFHNQQPQPAPEGTPRWIRCDVTDPDSVTAGFAEAVDQLGGLDVLIHTAGHWEGGHPGTLDIEAARRTIEVNFLSTVLTNEAAYATMGPAGGGHIINFGSSEGVSGSPISPIYAAAKAAVTAWTRSAARAWGRDRVTVNALAPAVATPGLDRRREFLGPVAAAAEAERLRAMIPIGGALGDPATALAPMLVFLAGDGADFITGQLIAVNGGLLMLG
ncbi:MAG: SDR family oxidoreductase [Gordonia sp. (in: high G+C Gram-positive bacteria)]